MGVISQWHHLGGSHLFLLSYQYGQVGQNLFWLLMSGFLWSGQVAVIVDETLRGMCEKAVVIELITVVSSCIHPIDLPLVSPGTIWAHCESHTCAGLPEGCARDWLAQLSLVLCHSSCAVGVRQVQPGAAEVVDLLAVWGCWQWWYLTKRNIPEAAAHTEESKGKRWPYAFHVCAVCDFCHSWLVSYVNWYSFVCLSQFELSFTCLQLKHSWLTRSSLYDA